MRIDTSHQQQKHARRISGDRLTGNIPDNHGDAFPPETRLQTNPVTADSIVQTGQHRRHVRGSRPHHDDRRTTAQRHADTARRRRSNIPAGHGHKRSLRQRCQSVRNPVRKGVQGSTSNSHGRRKQTQADVTQGTTADAPDRAAGVLGRGH